MRARRGGADDGDEDADGDGDAGKAGKVRGRRGR